MLLLDVWGSRSVSCTSAVSHEPGPYGPGPNGPDIYIYIYVYIIYTIYILYNHIKYIYARDLRLKKSEYS